MPDALFTEPLSNPEEPKKLPYCPHSSKVDQVFDLSPEERSRNSFFNGHLNGCPTCRHYWGIRERQQMIAQGAKGG